MIKVKNLSSGEITTVYNVKTVEMNDVQIIVAEPQCPNPQGRFFRNYPCMVDGNDFLTLESKGQEIACKVLSIAEGYELCEKGKRGRAPQQPQPEQPMPTPQPENNEEVKNEQPAPDTTGIENELAAKYGNMGKDIFNAAVRLANIIRPQASVNMDEVNKAIDERIKTQEANVTRIQINEREPVKIEGVVCDDFEDIVRDVELGYYPYLHGAAGCGKSHTAEQVAKALGLDFYAQTTLQFAHDVKGYGDAGGKFVDTAFFKAFSGGGLYFQDEFDRSMPEATVVLNTALSQGYYDFPVVGRVNAHKDFRFMAAGNTRMTGADSEYVTGMVQDASTRNRMAFYEMSYDRRIELPIMAHGDEVLVNFVEDVRQAIKTTRISHCVSYRETAYMYDWKDQPNGMKKALKRRTFKALDVDEIRVIYGALSDKNNSWAKATAELINA